MKRVLPKSSSKNPLRKLQCMDENYDRLFLCNTLWDKIRERSRLALRCKALMPIATDCEFIYQNKISFVIRMLTSLARKKENQKRQQGREKKANPFLPYDKNLFVTDISPTHVGLLNKFNVVENHLLIITREFEEQERVLTLHDFEAMFLCLAEFPGMAFYNGGKRAGASQSHKHLQVIPLSSFKNMQVPIESIIDFQHRCEGKITTLLSLPFVNAFVASKSVINPFMAAKQGYEHYCAMLISAEIKVKNGKADPYNFLATRQWMLLVPRRKESLHAISLNSLAFAGAFLVKNEREMQIIRTCEPMAMLKEVAMPAKS